MARKQWVMPAWEGPGSPQTPVPMDLTTASGQTDQPGDDSQMSYVHASHDSQAANDQSANDSQSPNVQAPDDSQRSSGREVHATEGRVLSLGIDSAGGYAVPYQLDGTKKKRRPRK